MYWRTLHPVYLCLEISGKDAIQKPKIDQDYSHPFLKQLVKGVNTQLDI